MNRFQRTLVALFAAGVTVIPTVAATTATTDQAGARIHQDGGFKGMS